MSLLSLAFSVSRFQSLGITWNEIVVKWGNGDVVADIADSSLESAKEMYEDRYRFYCDSTHPCKDSVMQCWMDHTDVHEIYIFADVLKDFVFP